MKDNTNFLQKGGFDATSLAFEKGMVLALSLWDDHYANMLWLDSCYPADQATTDPGICRGTCDVTSGDPKDVEGKFPHAFVRYMNIRYGEIGSTDPMDPIPGPGPAPGPSPSPSPVGAGNCCYADPVSQVKSCDSGNCPADPWCGASEDHCTNFCNGLWCPDSPTPTPSPPPTPTPSPTPSPSPTPVPSDCPGGSLSSCIDLCPGDDADIFEACVMSCKRRCGQLLI